MEKNNKEKNLKKFLILAIMCIVIILIYEIIHIYAIFYSETEGNVKLKNGIWNIDVNGTEISKGTSTSFVIDKINLDENANIKEGKLAPGLSGDFTISINPRDTNVSVKYELSLDQQELEDNDFFKIKSVKEVETGAELIKTGENTYTGIIPLEKIQNGTQHQIKIEIEWNDDGTHDYIDTELGKIPDNKLQIPVVIKVSQYLGENIIPYKE